MGRSTPSRGESNSTAALLTLPPHRPHRAELPQWVPQVRLPAPAKPAQLVDWAPLDIHCRVLSLVYVALRRCVYLFAPSLQWVRWPPLSGALPFPTFAGVESEEVGLSPCLRPLAQTARAVFPQAAFLYGRRAGVRSVVMPGTRLIKRMSPSSVTSRRVGYLR
jgi:hypothetical protein